MMKIKMKRQWIWAICVLLTATVATAAEQGFDMFNAFGDKQKRDKDALTVIEADQMDIDINNNRATFKGNVVIDDQAIRIECDRMDILLAEDATKKGGKKIVSVDCVGNVRINRKLYDEKDIEQGEQRAVAGKATYEIESGKVTMSDQPVLMRGKDSVSGETITFWRGNNVLNITGRSRVRLRPGDLEEKPETEEDEKKTDVPAKANPDKSETKIQVNP
jgi:lipopolysaccharide transport protein LptA